jgi:hypothetical protein
MLLLPVHFRQIHQISRPMSVMNNAPHYPYIQALAAHCSVLSLLRLQWAFHVFPAPLYAISATDLGVDMGSYYQLLRIGHA